MHEARSSVRCLEPRQAPALLVLVVGGERPHDDRHRPDHILADVRPAHSFCRRATEEIRVGIAQYKTPRGLVYRIASSTRPEVGHGQQTGHIGIVHAVGIAESVDFVSPDFTRGDVVNARMRIKGSLDLRTQPACLACRGAVVCDFNEHLFNAFQCLHREEIARNVQRVDACIIGRPKAGVNKTDRTRRVAIAVFTQCVVGREGLALEVVGTTRGFALLGRKSFEDGVHRVCPLGIEWLCVVRDAPVFVREAHGIAERIDFPLAFSDTGLHVGVIGLAPRERFGAAEIGHEGVRVWIGEDAASLAANDAFDQPSQV